MAISFKSVGKTLTRTQLETQAISRIPYGLKTPLRRSSKGETFFAMNYNLEEQVEDNFRNLLLTNFGERLGLYDFGTNLRPLLSEYASQEDFDNEAVNRIKSAVTKWMPHISLNQFQSTVDRTFDQKTLTVSIKITYDIPLLQVKDKSITVLIYAL